MNITLSRQNRTRTAVFGQLSVDTIFECYTLENPDVQIPAGTYRVEMTYSPRFNRPLPLLDNVPGRSAIRIHAGNWPRDTDGCILVGREVGDNMIIHSLAALDPLVAKIQDALEQKQDVWISVFD